MTVCAHSSTCPTLHAGLDPDDITIARSLPIFQYFTGRDEGFTSIDLSVHQVPPVNPTDSVNAELFRWLATPQAGHATFLCNCEPQSTGGYGANPALDHLLFKLGVPQHDASTFYAEHVLPRLAELPRSLNDRVMHQVLRDLPTLTVQAGGAEFERALREAAFVPSGTGALHSPSELFHQEVLTTTLGRALSEAIKDTRFAALDWWLTCEAGEIEALETLGMKRQVTRRFVVDQAIESCQIEDTSRAEPLAKAVLEQLCCSSWLIAGEADGTMSPDDFASAICDLEWLPVHKSPQWLAVPEALPWPEEVHSRSRARALNVRPRGDAPLVSATTCVLFSATAEGIVPPPLVEFFRWARPPALSILLTQLSAMVSLPVAALSRPGLAEFSSNMLQLYEALDGALCSLELEEEQLSDDVFEQLQSVGASECVWLDERFCFVAPSKVAKTGFKDACFEPHLFTLPAKLQRFETAMDKLGVREAFDPADYKWAISRERMTPFEVRPLEKTLRALVQGDREGADEAFMSDSIVNEIKGLLEHYPDGDTLLNELLRNADDSGATVVRLVLEEEGVVHGEGREGAG